jgi:hypothetical protein
MGGRSSAVDYGRAAGGYWRVVMGRPLPAVGHGRAVIGGAVMGRRRVVIGGRLLAAGRQRAASGYRGTGIGGRRAVIGGRLWVRRYRRAVVGGRLWARGHLLPMFLRVLTHSLGLHHVQIGKGFGSLI